MNLVCYQLLRNRKYDDYRSSTRGRTICPISARISSSMLMIGGIKYFSYHQIDVDDRSNWSLIHLDLFGGETYYLALAREVLLSEGIPS